MKHPICPECYERHNYQDICKDLLIGIHITDYECGSGYFETTEHQYSTGYTVYRPTNDEWGGNFKGSYVEMTISTSMKGVSAYIVVSGTDDGAVYRKFDTLQKGIDMFNKLQFYFMLNYKELEKLGFK